MVMVTADLVARYRDGNRDRDLKLFLVNYPQKPKDILDVLVSDLYIAEAASIHVNFAGKIEDGWIELSEDIIAQKDLGQDDLLIYELLEFAPVSDYFINKWMPGRQIANAIENVDMSVVWQENLLYRNLRNTSTRLASY